MLMLGVGSKGVGVLMYVARGGRQPVFAPVGSKDGGAPLHEAEDGLYLPLHHALFF